MAKATETKLPTLLVPVSRGPNGVDLAKTLKNAEEVIRKYEQEDRAATQAVVEVTERILTDERHKNLTDITAGALAKMALGIMGEIPTDKLEAEATARVKAYLQGQPEKFLNIARGRNAGFHFVDRLKATPEGQERLAKLMKEKEASDKAASVRVEE